MVDRLVWIWRCGVWVWLCLAPWAHAGMLVKTDIEAIFGAQFLVGDIQPNMPLWPLFVKPNNDQIGRAHV